MKTKLISIDVLGRRFQDVHNNTYHTAEVVQTYSDGSKFKTKSIVKYGYEREYEMTARKMCMSDARSPFLFRAGNELGINITSNCIDVKKESQL